MPLHGPGWSRARLLIQPQRRLRRHLLDVGNVRLGTAEQRVEAAHGLGLHRGHGVAVSVEGDGHVLVAEDLGHDLGVRAGRQLQGGEGVAQVVEADRRQLGRAQQRSELACGDVPTPQRLAGLVTEHEVVVGGAMYLADQLWDGSRWGRHRVWGRDDPLWSHSGYAFGPPWVSTSPHIIAPLLPCSGACYYPDPRSPIAHPPYGSGSARSRLGWREGFLGWAPIAWSFGGSLNVSVQRYQYGSLATVWINYDLGGLGWGCSVSWVCVSKVSATFGVSSQVGSFSRYTTIYDRAATWSHFTGENWSLAAPPRNYGHFNIWVPRSAGSITKAWVTQGVEQIPGQAAVPFALSIPLRSDLVRYAYYY